MLYLAYSAGLRVSEVVNLRVKDIHSARMEFWNSYENITLPTNQHIGSLKDNIKKNNTVREAFNRFFIGQNMRRRLFK
eukprot:gene37382-48888_t